LELSIGIADYRLGLPIADLALLNQQSALSIDNPQSQSTIRNLNRQSAISIRNRQSQNPQSSVRNPQSVAVSVIV
jgi:hypothetical protein